MKNLFKKSDRRCQVCLAEFYHDDIIAQGLKVCPNCGTAIPPQNIAEDGYIKVNWQELRVLAIYAKRWSQVFDLRLQADKDALRALDNILLKLGRFRPKNGLEIIPKQDGVIVQKAQMPTIPKIPQPEQPRGIPSPFYKKGTPPANEI